MHADRDEVDELAIPCGHLRDDLRLVQLHGVERLGRRCAGRGRTGCGAPPARAGRRGRGSRSASGTAARRRRCSRGSPGRRRRDRRAVRRRSTSARGSRRRAPRRPPPRSRPRRRSRRATPAGGRAARARCRFPRGPPAPPGRRPSCRRSSGPRRAPSACAPRRPPGRPRRSRAPAPSSESSSPSSKTITVMLSSPPPLFAASTSARAVRSRLVRLCSTTSRIDASSTIDVRPSEQIMKTSPGRASTSKVSTSTSGSVPSTRVITERCGWTSASSGESRPLRTSSATSEWSSVSCCRAPSRTR